MKIIVTAAHLMILVGCAPGFDSKNEEMVGVTVLPSKSSTTSTPSPTATPSSSATPRPTATPAPTSTPSPTPGPSPTVTPTPLPIPVPSATPTPSPTAPPLPTSTPRPNASPTPKPIGSRTYSTNQTEFYGSSRCALSGIQLCEDFETGTLGSNWSVYGKAPTIDAVHAARGNKSLHVRNGAGGTSGIQESVTFPAVKNTFWGRLFIYFESLPAAPMKMSHWTIVGATGTNVMGETRIGGFGPNNVWATGTDSNPGPGTGDWSWIDNDPAGKPEQIPLNKWICVEWMNKGDTNETRIYINGVEHPSMYASSTRHGGTQSVPYVLPTYNKIWFGFQEYQSTTQVWDMWIDEIAIDPERIGCSN